MQWILDLYYASSVRVGIGSKASGFVAAEMDLDKIIDIVWVWCHRQILS